MNPKFFVEFQFSYELTGRTYWLPLFLATNDANIANQITASTKKALEEHFQNVSHSAPIQEAGFTKGYIKHKFDIHRFYKVEILNADVWKFEDVQPDLSFNEQLDFVADIRPLVERDLAKLIDRHQFPVRVIREGKFPIDFKEFLLINIVTQKLS